MNSSYTGELAALGTALCWSFSSILFTLGGRRVGSLVVNRARLIIAVVLVSAAHLLLYGRLFPVDAGADRFLWLGLSALIGLVIGDTCLFQAYLLIGTRLASLLMSLAPVLAALLAWMLLGETMTAAEIGACLLALGGVTWVVLERTGGKPVSLSQPEEGFSARRYALGLLFGLGGAAGQGIGIVIAKQAMGDTFPALSASVIRMTSGTAMIWLITLVTGQASPTVRALRANVRADLAIAGGAFMGPFLGVWLSLLSVQAARVGIASTLMAMSPIMLIPLVRLVFGERVSSRATAGTFLALGGVALMFLT